MTKKIYYEKVGRKYVPVREYDSNFLDSFHKGTHLIVCHPHGRSTYYNIDPAFAPMIAAGKYAEEAISQKIMDTSALRCPTNRKPITDKQRAAWHALQDAFGDEIYPLEYCSYREATEAGVKSMLIEAERMLENPAVRKAWNNFMLIWQLTKESEKK